MRNDEYHLPAVRRHEARRGVCAFPLPIPTQPSFDDLLVVFGEDGARRRSC